MKGFLLGCFALLLASGRKFEDEIRNKAIKNTRRVQQFYGSSQQIYWNFGSDYWRLDMTPPVLNVGWEFVQSTPLVNKGATFPTTLTASSLANLLPASVT